MALRRASYRNAGEREDGEEEIAGYVSTVLIADLFNAEAEKVARAVLRIRKREVWRD